MGKNAITFRFNPLPEGYCPKNTNQLGNALASRFEGILPDTAGVLYKGSSVPPTDINGIWIKEGPQGPEGIYKFHNGFWVRAENRRIGEITLWSGNPSSFFDATGKGLTGSGPVALQWYGWAFCNGQNGTVDLRDRFVICQNDQVTPYNGQYRNNAKGSPTSLGGLHEVKLTVGQIPKGIKYMTFAPYWYKAGGQGGGEFLEDATKFFLTDVVGPNDEPHENMPPFFTLAYIQYIGY